MKLNYNVLKVGDIVLTTSLKPISIGIRIKETGILNSFHTNIATHVGIIVPIHAPGTRMLAIAEMLPDGLKVNSLSDYINNGYFGDRIVDIKRFPNFSDDEDEISQQIFKWWEEGKKYDFKGVLKYVLPFLKEKEASFYCSEMLEWLALNICRRDLLENRRVKNDNITPYDIQKSKLLMSVKGYNI